MDGWHLADSLNLASKGTYLVLSYDEVGNLFCEGGQWISRYPSMPLGLAGLRELILRRRRRPTILFQF
jgi:hypothetical protein